ncbi:YesL family protein [Ammoniphilus sp. 3BR4]|uniref:YesL family protein n=1 Tax=Ammoniphilus sp. 3BR4 TaxID=3158265 RepID=UPI0034655E14
MPLNGYLGVFQQVFTWLMRLTYLNMLWLGFTLIGGIVFGFFPSTAALFSVLRQCLREGPESGGVQPFWEFYRREFFRSQKIGLSLFLAGYILYVDLQLFASGENFLSMVFQWIAIGFIFVYGIVLVFVFPVFVHLEGTVIQLLKNSLVFAVSHWAYAFIIAAGWVMIAVILIFLPALLFLIGGSLYALWSTWVFQKIWERLEFRKGMVRSEA